jgi:hypothetical protein
MVSPGVVLSILPSAASWQESLYGVDIWSLRKPELSWMSIAHIWLVVSTISLSFIIDIGDNNSFEHDAAQGEMLL